MATVGQYGAEIMVNAATGVPLPPYTQVTVYLSDGVTLATLYTSLSGGTQAANPTTLDQYSNLTFYTTPGYYQVAATVNGVQGNKIPVVVSSNALVLDGTATDIQSVGTGAQSAGSIGKAADSGHVHPLSEIVSWVANTNYPPGVIVTYSNGLYQAPSAGITGASTFQTGWVHLADIGGGGALLALTAVTPTTSPYTATTGQVVLANAGTTPAVHLGSSSAGAAIWVKKTDSSSTAVVVTAVSGNIDGATSMSLLVQYDAAMFVYDGTNWWVF